MAEAASIISMQWAGYAVSSPLIGKLSDRVKRRKPFLYASALLGAIVSAIILGVPVNKIVLYPLFILVGAAIAGQTLTFTIILENAPKKLHSSALGVNNAISMLFAALIAMIVGWIIQSSGGSFSEPALTKGLMVVPVLLFLAFLVALFGIKETYCRQQHEVHALHKYSDIF